MQNKLYALYDSKAEAYSGPISHRTKGEAIRTFSDECNNPESVLYKHPEDYTLFEVGTFSIENGTITPHQACIAIGKAVDFKKQMSIDDTQLSLAK